MNKNRMIRFAAFMMAMILCLSMFPITVFADEPAEQPEEIAGEETQPDPTEEPALPVSTAEQAENDDADEPEDTEPPPESCEPYDHISDADGVCTVCGMDLIAEFYTWHGRIDRDKFIAAWNAYGWYEQTGDETYADAEAGAMLHYEALQTALDILGCIELGISDDRFMDEFMSIEMELLELGDAAMRAYQFPRDPGAAVPEPDDPEPDDPSSDTGDEILFGGLPDAPTGSYMSSRGLPVATGNTKISISPWNSNLFDTGTYMDAAALNADGLTLSVGKEDDQDYAIVPIMVQMEYPGNGSSATIRLPDGVELLSYDGTTVLTGADRDAVLHTSYYDTSASVAGIFVRATRDFTASFTYTDARGNSIAKTLNVVIADGADSGLQSIRGAASKALASAERPAPSVTSGVITKVEYVVDTWLIWFNGEPAYCCDHGLNGKPAGCPTYGYSHTSVISADQYTGDHYTTQVTIWGGLNQVALGYMEAPANDGIMLANELDEDSALLDFCSRIYDGKQMYIITAYPDSEAARIYLESARQLMSGAAVIASPTGYYTYIYAPPVGGWQRVAVIGPPTDEEEGEDPPPPEYYAEWSAPVQTRSGSFNFSYKINVDKSQLETGEKVSDAVIDIEPLAKSGIIDGGSWSISPATKQTVTTSAHTNDDNYQNTGGAGSAAWTLHYEVTKTSGTRNGRVGPYASQNEADSAAAAARSSAISELQAEAQRAVDNAIAAAKRQLNSLQFKYNETVVPLGFLACDGANGSSQTISVTQGTNDTYPMVNDKWSIKVRIEKTDSETGNQIAADAVFEIYEWDTVTQQYIPTGGYNRYRVERQPDGTYKVVNGSSYAVTDEMKETLYYTQRNEGKFVIVETSAPDGYFGDWTDIDQPGTPGTPLGKRAYYIQITCAKDGHTIWLSNKDYNADISTRYTTGIKLLTSGGVTTSVTMGTRDAVRIYITDNSGTAANENSYTMTPRDNVLQNDRVLGEISISKVDLDAMRYLTGDAAHGNAVLDGAVYDLYAAEDITHPDGVSGVVDYSAIRNADGDPVWHTTVRDNAGTWITDYLPILCKDHLVASAEIKDGWLTFSNLYLGKYYVVERSTGTVIAENDGAFVVTGSYPAVDPVTKAATGGKIALATDGAGQYTDYVYRNQFSGISQSKDLAGNRTYDGYYRSFAAGYLADEENHYITPAYYDEGWYIEKNTFEDNRQGVGVGIDNTRYSANVHNHRDNDLAESRDQVMKTNVQLAKVVSSTGQSNGLDLEGAGFSFFLISDLSKAADFERAATGNYKLNSILAAYINPTYSDTELKYDFSGEAQALARCYEVDADQITAYNRTLTDAGDHRNGTGDGWVPTGVPNQYQLSEIFSNDTGCIRVEGLPYGQYLCVETTVPHDLYQAEPFIVNVTAADSSVPQSGMCNPSHAAVPGSNSYLRYTILDEEIEVYLRIVKADEETGKPVLLPDTAFWIYWLDEDGNYRLDDDGNPKRVIMTDTTTGHLPKDIDTFYTTDEGILTLPEHLPLGKYRIVEVSGVDGFYNEWIDTGGFWLDFIVSTDRAYQATGEDNENGQDMLVIDEVYNNHETLGRLTIRKLGEVLIGWDGAFDEDGMNPMMRGQAGTGGFIYDIRPIAGAEYTITAAEDIYTQDRQLDANGNRTLWYAAGDVVAVIRTGDGDMDTVSFAPGRTQATHDFLTVTHDGTPGEVTITLPLGRYVVKESAPPYAFTGTEQSYEVSFTWENQTQSIIDAPAVLEYHNDRQKANVKVLKCSAEDDKPLAGAVFGLYNADDIYGFDGDLLLPADSLIAVSSVTGADGYALFDADIPIRGELYGRKSGRLMAYYNGCAFNSGDFYIVELTPPSGYYLNTDPIPVNFTGSGEAVVTLEAVYKNKPTEMWISKRDLTNDEELPGATLTVTAADGTIVKEWVSTDKPECLTGLDFYETYTLTETRPVDGYALADSITFLLVQAEDESGAPLDKTDVYYLKTNNFLFWTWDDWELLDGSTVIMRDDITKVQISKKDIATGEELPGAELVITDANGNEIERWISGDTPHYIEKLPAGNYILKEITAPEGFAVAESVAFVVLPTGEIQSITMFDAPLPAPTPAPQSTPPSAPTSPEPTPTPAPVVIPLPAVKLPQTGELPWLTVILGGAALLAVTGLLFLYLNGRDGEDQDAETEEE